MWVSYILRRDVGVKRFSLPHPQGSLLFDVRYDEMTNDCAPQEVQDYVEKNRDDLAYVLLNGEDETVRSLALAALLRGGSRHDAEAVKDEIDRLQEER